MLVRFNERHLKDVFATSGLPVIPKHVDTTDRCTGDQDRELLSVAR